MAWIELHQALVAHPKTKRLARRLGVNLPTAIGTLACLWCWCVEYAQDGNLERFDAQDIADAAEWTGDPEALIAALVEASFVDAENDVLRIHNWHKYAGRLMEQRRHHAANKQRARALYDNAELTKFVRDRDGDCCRYCGVTANFRDRKGAGGGTYDHVDPDGPNTLDNIVVACRACNAGKGRRTPDAARMPLLPPTGKSARNLHVGADKSAITVPNLTQHDQDPPQPPKGGGVVASGEPEVDPAPAPEPFEDGPVREPSDGDDILEAKSPSLVQVPAPSSRQVRPAPKPRDVYTSDFEAFWKLREWSGDKPVAHKHWVAAGLDVDEAKREVVMAAVAAQLADRAKAATAGVWYANWKHAEGWISGQRWNDPLKCEAGPKVVPIASGPADDLAGHRKLVAWCHSDRERIEVLVDRARGVNKVVLDLAEALEILEGRGIDAAIRWVAMATRAGVQARQGVSRG